MQTQEESCGGASLTRHSNANSQGLFCSQEGRPLQPLQQSCLPIQAHYQRGTRPCTSSSQARTVLFHSSMHSSDSAQECRVASPVVAQKEVDLQKSSKKNPAKNHHPLNALNDTRLAIYEDVRRLSSVARDMTHRTISVEGTSNALLIVSYYNANSLALSLILVECAILRRYSRHF